MDTVISSSETGTLEGEAKEKGQELKDAILLVKDVTQHLKSEKFNQRF